MIMDEERIEKFAKVAKTLSSVSDEHIIHTLENAKPLHKGIGGHSHLIYIDKIPVFVKKIPVADREALPPNYMSTANIFDLPLCYQYGVGSAGFSAWRELNTHIFTNQWAVTGKCPNFPLLYAWRLLPANPADIDTSYWGDLNEYTQYWDNSNKIRKRIDEMNTASSQLILFLEFIPETLHQWLQDKMMKDEREASSALSFVNESLKRTNDFMKSNGLIHFDAHFANILTDGKEVYFTDFGLALSSNFQLSPEEQDFFAHHINYDEACSSVNFLHCIVTSLFGEDEWIAQLRKIISGELTVQPFVRDIINDHAELALIMDQFFTKLRKSSKSTPYPASIIHSLLKQRGCNSTILH